MPGVSRAVINTASATDVTLGAATSGYQWQLLNIFVMSGGTTNLTFKSNTTALSGPLPMIANGGFGPGEAPIFGHIISAPGEALVLTNSAAVQISGWATVRAIQTE